MGRLHIAIIGCGFTGTSAFYQLVHHRPVGHITVFEKTETFGPGFPYRADESPEYLINNTNDTMCMDPANRRAFVEWLQADDRHSQQLDERGHLPRAVYGEFLEDTVRRTVAEAERRNIGVDFVAREVVDIEETAGGVTVRCEGAEVTADAALITTGRCPDRDVFGLQDAADNRYFATHMPGTRLDVLPADAEVYVMGASLSAYDVVNQLFAPSTGCRFERAGENRLEFVPCGNERRVWLCSRSGRMKKIQSRYPNPPSFAHLAGALQQDRPRGEMTLDELFGLFLLDAADAGVEIDRAAMADPYAGCSSAPAVNARAAGILAQDIDAAAAGPGSVENFIVDYLDASQMTIWDLFAARLLSAEEEARYRSRFETAMLSYAAPCPSPTAQKILALMQCGRLRVLKGVSAVERQSSCSAIRIEHEFGVASADYVVNSTGAVDRRVGSARQPTLIANLYRKGLLEPYCRAGRELDGAAVDMSSLRLPGTRHVHLANKFLWGPGFYVSSAIMMARLVERILDDLFRATSSSGIGDDE